MNHTIPSSPMTDLAVLRDRYDRDGVVHVEQVLSRAETDEIRAVFMAQVEADRFVGAVEEVTDDDVLARYPRFLNPHRRPELEVGRRARALMTDARLLDLVTALIGPAYGAQSMFYFKPPAARGQALHQDGYFLRSHPETCIAAWIAVDECDAANGALQVVPGSQAMEVVCPQDANPAESFTDKVVHVPTGLTVQQTRMRAGDVLLFHGSTVHGSLPNTTADRFRRSLIFHYVPQTSTEIAGYYLPLVSPDGSEVTIAQAGGGGPCGDQWAGAAH
ncbi:phytanoyl-CoA dioxygenase family protein [Kitasatospora paracochleata]|uniref:Ectoine hydroxylase-related dioxygenase (Phytanoyl-CoA dioxygenase family) n=1 Tax=Kitasatospora paracochleata TaxID=58354 RepID=A0ABT1J8C4_9ACTN|nr:phytanoyl-CoA dioxygenase family protein [Kitasatospora paracochleata]MCP2313685.1 ectoine hydroxylase-related dioxygenase (phytanoyl-CoA dioxygenase family) [Kitasatospora paracochleata]